jgi:hypothetical protein
MKLLLQYRQNTWWAAINESVMTSSNDHKILQAMKTYTRGWTADGTEAFNSEVALDMNFYMKGRRFFVSPSGLIGMAQAGSQVGDKICIPFGCFYPVILRSHNKVS